MSIPASEAGAKVEARDSGSTVEAWSASSNTSVGSAAAASDSAGCSREGSARPVPCAGIGAFRFLLLCDARGGKTAPSTDSQGSGG